MTRGGSTLGPSYRSRWFSVRAFLGAFVLAGLAGVITLLLLLGIDEVFGTRLALDEEGFSLGASFVMFAVFVPAYGLLLARIRGNQNDR